MLGIVILCIVTTISRIKQAANPSMRVFLRSILVVLILLICDGYTAEPPGPGKPCDEIGDGAPDPENCGAYYLCASAIQNNVWIPDTCDDGEVADQNGFCNPGKCEETATFDCPAHGVQEGNPPGRRGFPDPENCNKYWYCWPIGHGEWHAEYYTCDDGKFFSNETESCQPGPCQQ